jgi:hypothetical protein
MSFNVICRGSPHERVDDGALDDVVGEIKKNESGEYACSDGR